MISIYLGSQGCGKSTLIRKHVAELARTFERAGSAVVFLVVDHDDSWTAREFPGAMFFLHTDAYRALDELPRVAIFRGVDPLDVAQLALDVGDAVYVDDEIDVALGDGKWKDSPIREIVKRGRHIRAADGEIASVSALVATHRPANLPTDISGLFTRVYVGRLFAYVDAERVYREGWIRGQNSALGVQRELEARRPGEFTYWPTP